VNRLNLLFPRLLNRRPTHQHRKKSLVTSNGAGRHRPSGTLSRPGGYVFHLKISLMVLKRYENPGQMENT
jgi:hypothetical protein